MKKPYSVVVWHTNGVGVDPEGQSIVRVYRNGKLKNTKGKQELIVITIE